MVRVSWSWVGTDPLRQACTLHLVRGATTQFIIMMALMLYSEYRFISLCPSLSQRREHGIQPKGTVSWKEKLLWRSKKYLFAWSVCSFMLSLTSLSIGIFDPWYGRVSTVKDSWDLSSALAQGMTLEKTISNFLSKTFNKLIWQIGKSL